jgi:hypothetical protein
MRHPQCTALKLLLNSSLSRIMSFQSCFPSFQWARVRRAEEVEEEEAEEAAVAAALCLLRIESFEPPPTR